MVATKLMRLKKHGSRCGIGLICAPGGVYTQIDSRAVWVAVDPTSGNQFNDTNRIASLMP